jgi:hypothetical protein
MVLTLTKGERPILLEQCKRSVALALPPGARHQVQVCPSLDDFAVSRIASLSQAKRVAFVDDDDTIHPNGLNVCMQALDESHCGLAHTSHVLMNGDKVQNTYGGPRTYRQIASDPRAIQQLTVIETASVDLHKVKWLYNKHQLEIDWIIRAAAALSSDSIHIDMIGYYWRYAPDSYFRNTELYSPRVKALRRDIKALWSRDLNQKERSFNL